MAAICRQCNSHIPDIFAAQCPGCGVPITQENVILQEGQSQFAEPAPTYQQEFDAQLYGLAAAAVLIVVATLLVFLLLTFKEQDGSLIVLPRPFMAIYLLLGRWGILAVGLAISGLFVYGALGFAYQLPGFPRRDPPAPPSPPTAARTP